MLDLAALSTCLEQCASAREATFQRDYGLALSVFGEVLTKMYALAESAPEHDRKRLLKAVSDIEAEKAATEELKKQEAAFVAEFSRKRDSPDAPPADPDVWPDPPRRTSSVSHDVGRRSTAKTSVKGRDDGKRGPAMKKSTSQNALNDRRKKTAGAGTSDDTALSKDGSPNSTVQGKEEKEFDSSGYDSAIVSAVESIMQREGSLVGWDDIAGLEETKQLFKETVILPSLMPQVFKGIRRPWRGVCMVGPPGTGKTMLAKAVASECKSTFFSVNICDFASKWRGDSERMVRLLFEMARFYSPSTIFIDEIDTIGSQRGAENEHEASRRVKAQLLTEMDGFSSGEDKRVLVLAATNFPWHLDSALRRRFEKRIYIPLPDVATRLALIKSAIKDVKVAEGVDLDRIAQSLEGFSGADVVAVCRQAALMGVSKLTRNLTSQEIAQLEPETLLNVPILNEDFEAAMHSVKPSVNQEDLKKYADWMENFGSS